MPRPVGSGLHDDVRREMRECPEHGLQTHARRYQGYPPSPKMVCMQHERDSNARSEAKRKSGAAMQEYHFKKPERPRRRDCPDCYVEVLPAGDCPSCGETPKERS